MTDGYGLESVESILFCSSAGFGIGNVAYNLVDKFSSAGVDVTYCTNPFNDIPPGAEPLYFLDGDRYQRILDTVENTKAYPAVQLLYANIYFWIRANRYIKRHRWEYDVIWLNGPHAIPAALQREALDGALATLHNSLYSERPDQHSGLYGLYYRLAGSLQGRIMTDDVGHITVVDDGICAEVERAGVSADKVSYIPNGVNTEKFRPQETTYLQDEYDIPPDHTVLLSLGRMTAQKDPKRLVRLFDAVSERIDDVTLVMAGSGELLEEVKTLGAELGGENVVFPGYVPEADKASLYAGADFYVMSSAYEGQPLTLFEAMASGTPCIVPDLPNLKMVAEADAGIRIDFDADDAADTVVEYVLADQSQAGENARQYAETTLGWDAVCEQYAEVLEACAND